MIDYEQDVEKLTDLVQGIYSISDEKDERLAYNDIYTTRQQRIRDEEVTKLLKSYVEGYNYKVKSNKWYKSVLVILSSCIVVAFAVCLIVTLYKFTNSDELKTMSSLIELISVCITFLSLIIGILKIITKYVFPEKEDEYITRIVEIIQNNDLQNKKENIAIQKKRKK